MDVRNLSLERNDKKMYSEKQKWADTDSFSCDNIVERLASVKQYPAVW